jgi:hypothetical protein
MQARQLAKSDPPPFQLSLRIRHPSMDPADLSRELNMEAVHFFRAGDPRPQRSGIAPASVHAESYWLGAIDPNKWPADILSFPGHSLLQIAQEHLSVTAINSFGWALSLCATWFFHSHAEFLRRIRSDGGQISLLVALSTGEVGSFSLSPEASRAFGELGITVEFEFVDA